MNLLQHETGRRLSVCYVSPTFFGRDSVIGGGERYAEELARAMSLHADVRSVSFGRRAQREHHSASFERVILRSWVRDKLTPFSPRLFTELANADVIHCFQYFVLPTFLAALYGHQRGKRVFVSDLGGGGWTPAYQIDQSRWITCHLPISEYAAHQLPGANKASRVILGGVDTARYAMRPATTHDGSVVFLGRILPHKGVHHLLRAIPPEIRLDVIGTEGDQSYRSSLEQLAEGKNVRFLAGLSDAEVIARLQTAMALVHLTPVDENGSAGVNELFGLTLVEAMACGCPVIASSVASLPEVLGPVLAELLVPPNSPEAVPAVLQRLAGDAEAWSRLSLEGRRRVETCFTWNHVAARCLEAYSDCAS